MKTVIVQWAKKYVAGAVLVAGLWMGIAQAETAAPNRSLSTGIADQTGLAVTIYNVNLGLVKDTRNVPLPTGASELRFMDVASQIIPASVHMASLVNPEGLRVLEQNYEYDLLSPQKLLDKYVGREVRLSVVNPHTEREEITAATLLSVNGTPVYRIGNEITFGHPGRVIFPAVPEGLNSKPTLVWMLENDAASQQLEASYLTSGLTWKADYVMTLSPNDDSAALTGWVTIDNRSGATYKDAKIELVAGDVNRVREELFRDKAIAAQKLEARPAAAPQFREESFFEYHLYTLGRPSTIRDNQTKQISLITAEEVPVSKELRYNGSRTFYFSQSGEVVSNQKIGVYIEIENREKNHLGIPMPKGTVRVYKQDRDGSLQFVGEDAIDHTPKDEKIRIKLGDAFDVVGTRKQTDWKKIAYDTYEAAFEITLKNHKKEDVVVRVVEPVPGDWVMLSSSRPYEKTQAFTAEFKVPVPKDGEAKLAYRVKMRY